MSNGLNPHKGARRPPSRGSEGAKDYRHHTVSEAHEASKHVLPSQAALLQPGRPPDVFSPRDKGSGKGKKTADKWNQ
ncbi:MAG TPA: hypothetical protein VMI13_10265 [Solirubrobacteraceae bacterium]|nr:hypothetical protein [Solirubrobacteraceae bacterium]